MRYGFRILVSIPIDQYIFRTSSVIDYRFLIHSALQEVNGSGDENEEEFEADDTAEQEGDERPHKTAKKRKVF